jgi:hypothetical protein
VSDQGLRMVDRRKPSVISLSLLWLQLNRWEHVHEYQVHMETVVTYFKIGLQSWYWPGEAETVHINPTLANLAKDHSWHC